MANEAKEGASLEGTSLQGRGGGGKDGGLSANSHVGSREFLR